MKKVIIIASAILFFILLLFLSLSKTKKSSINNQTQLLTPTLTQVNINNKPDQKVINNALLKTPYETEDFRFDYSSSLNQLVVTEKSPQAKEKFKEWASQNNLSELASNPESVVFQTTLNNQSSNNNSLNKDQSSISNTTTQFLNIFFNLGKGNGIVSFNNINFPTPSPKSNTPNLVPTKKDNQTQTQSSNFAYYAQCDSEYSSLPLPDGCNMCQAGCGAATVAMIASSYLGSQYDPKTIINIYKDNEYLLSCDGSRYQDAKSILNGLGLKTTDYMTFDYEIVDQVVGDLKKYLSSGWTFFTLADFTEGEGGGHYFWITDIDSENNVWAYDPYYGRFEAPPINENSRYPFPKYRVVFGVKK